MLTLAMIVRDGGQNLADLLDGARPWVDEIVVGDTGSQDDSATVARDRGARVIHLSWQDDFAAARNAVLDCCTGHYILVLDADELVSQKDWQTLRDWVAGCHGSRQLAAADLGTRNYLPGRNGRRGWIPVPDPDPHALPGGPIAPGYVVTRKVRLFPNQPTMRFQGHIHETVEDSLMAAGIPIVELDTPVHHFGYLSSRQGKRAHYLHLAHLKTSRQPHSAQAWGELADCAIATGDLVQALVAVERSLNLDPTVAQNQLTAGWLLVNTEDFTRAEVYLAAVAGRPEVGTDLHAEAAHLRAQIAIRRERPQRAVQLLAVALRLYPDNGHYQNTLASLQLLLGRESAARDALVRACALLPDQAGPCLNLGMLMEATGDTAAAAPHYEEALRRDPENTGAAAGLERTRPSTVCV